jgi:hypothetical protein
MATMHLLSSRALAMFFSRVALLAIKSHGMSIDSLGQNQALFANVSITFNDITVVNAVYAARFKSCEGGQGLAKNITSSNIGTYNVSFPIFVTQTYINQGSAQTQIENGQTAERPSNSTVVMEDVFSSHAGIMWGYRTLAMLK